MKLYLITSTIDGGNYATWAGSQADAAAARKGMVEMGAKRKDISTHEIEVPTKKDDLIGFLNLLSTGAQNVAITEKLISK